MEIKELAGWTATIKSLSSFLSPDKKTGVVRLETSDGTVGWGQFGNKDVDISEELFHRRIAPAVIGERVNNPWGLVNTIIGFELNYKCMGVQLNKAMAGFDSAVWDACGKKAGKSVCELLTQGERKLSCYSVYASSISRKITAEELSKELVRLRDDFGIQAFKIKVGKRMQSVIGKTKEEKAKDQWPGRTEQVVRAARDSLGPDVMLAVDANGAFPTMDQHSERVFEVARLLRDCNVAFFEEAFYWPEYSAYQRLVDANIGVKVAGGEQEFRMDVWRNVLPFEILQPDFGYCGGTSNAVEIESIARKNGKKFTPHSPQGDMHVVFALHLACAFDAKDENHIELACVNDGICQIALKKDGAKTGYFRSPLFSPDLRVEKGRIKIDYENSDIDNKGNAGGWGVTIRESWLEVAKRRDFDSVVASASRSKL